MTDEPDRNILYVLGNHEFYGSHTDDFVIVEHAPFVTPKRFQRISSNRLAASTSYRCVNSSLRSGLAVETETPMRASPWTTFPNWRTAHDLLTLP